MIIFRKLILLIQMTNEYETILLLRYYYCKVHCIFFLFAQNHCVVVPTITVKSGGWPLVYHCQYVYPFIPHKRMQQTTAWKQQVLACTLIMEKTKKCMVGTSEFNSSIFRVIFQEWRKKRAHVLIPSALDQSTWLAPEMLLRCFPLCLTSRWGEQVRT